MLEQGKIANRQRPDSNRKHCQPTLFLEASGRYRNIVGRMFAAASIDVRLRPGSHADLPLVVASLQNLVLASVWGAMCLRNFGDASLREARGVVRRTAAVARSALQITGEANFDPRFVLNPTADAAFNPFDPLTAAVQCCWNVWLSRTLTRTHAALHDRLFSFFSIGIAETISSKDVRLTVDLRSASPCAPLLYGCMNALCGVHVSEHERSHDDPRGSGSWITNFMERAIIEAVGPIAASSAVRKTAQVASITAADLWRHPRVAAIVLAHIARSRA